MRIRAILSGSIEPDTVLAGAIAPEVQVLRCAQDDSVRPETAFRDDSVRLETAFRDTSAAATNHPPL